MLLINLFISPLSFPPPPLFVCLFVFFPLRRAAQQSRWSVHVSSATPTSASAPCLHLRPPGTIRSGQPAKEDHANTVPNQPGGAGGRQQLEHRSGPASQQLGAQQQHPPRDQVTECNRLHVDDGCFRPERQRKGGEPELKCYKYQSIFF